MTKPAIVLVLAAIASLMAHLSAPAACAQAPAGHGAAAQSAAQPEGAAAGEGASEGHEAEGYDASQWKNFFLRVMNFAAYVALLYFILRKPVGAFLGGRRQGIARQVEYLETQARNYEEQAKVMRRRLDDLAGERAEALRRYEAEGAKERDRIIEEAKKAAELIVQRTQAAMDQELKAVRRDLVVATGRTALAMARDMLAKTVTSEDRVRLTHEFVEQVVKLPAKN